ncbi:MAG: TlyA family RNA methyltransferase [Oscillospiraceae bacterium]|jgi:23S rRNA (cytidine1920-2'-O)/16S rRNA (cytidine1409-2'-O)-methyltransferase|nr:TlyA family RNA methyltransferase [Oscillospiraceae bacterium]
MTRLDVRVYELGFAESRSKAHELILSGSVTVNGETVTKPSEPVNPEARLELVCAPKYIGRAGYKLETAADAFGIDFTDLICLDAGAAAGGFTDLMLQKGAKKIYAVDVGENQLHRSLRQNPRVISAEKQDIRTLALPERVDFITADLSFISLKLIIPCFRELLKANGACIVLIKPQFEAGKRHFKNGIIKDGKIIKQIVRGIEDFITEQGYQLIGTIPSKLNEKGRNQEFLCYFKRGTDL